MTPFDAATYLDPTRADNAAGLAKLGADVQAAGGGEIEFPYGIDYPILTAPGAVGSQVLVSWSGLKALKIRMNGSRLLIGDPNANAQGWQLFNFQNCDNIHLEDMRAEQVNAPIRSQSGGMRFLTFGDTCRGVDVRRAYSRGGVWGAAFTASTPTLAAALRAREISVDLETEEVLYGMSFQGNGDQASGKVRCKHPGRSYFPWNVRQHRFDVWSDHNDGYQDVLIGAAVGVGDSTISNIEVDYVNMADANYPGSDGKIWIGVAGAQQPGGATVSNIRVRFDINSTRQSPSPIIQVDDTSTPAGNKLFSNIKLGGRLAGFPVGIPGAITFFRGAGVVGASGDWAFNVGIEDLDLESSASGHTIAINGVPFSGAFFMHRVRGWSWTYDETVGAVPAAYKDFRQVALQNLSA